MKKTFFYSCLFLVLTWLPSTRAQILAADATTSRQLKGASLYVAEDQLTLVLHGAEITSLGQVHSIFSHALLFPSYYGRNLDALFDLLTEPEFTPLYLRIIIDDSKKLKSRIGAAQFEALVLTLKEAKATNENIELNLVNL